MTTRMSVEDIKKTYKYAKSYNVEKLMQKLRALGLVSISHKSVLKLFDSVPGTSR